MPASSSPPPPAPGCIFGWHSRPLIALCPACLPTPALYNTPRAFCCPSEPWEKELGGGHWCGPCELRRGLMSLLCVPVSGVSVRGRGWQWYLQWGLGRISELLGCLDQLPGLPLLFRHHSRRSLPAATYPPSSRSLPCPPPPPKAPRAPVGVTQKLDQVRAQAILLHYLTSDTFGALSFIFLGTSDL